MRLEYEIVGRGDQQLRKMFRSIDQEAERSYQKDLRRDRSRVSHRRQTARAAVAAVSAAERKAEAEKARAAARELRDQERNAKRAASAQVREIKRVEREEAKSLKWRQAMRNRHFQQMERQQRMHEAKQLRVRANTAKSIQAGIGRVASGTMGTVGRGLSYVGATATLAGSFLAGSSIRKQATVHEKAALLANQAFDPNSGPSREEIKAATIKQAKEIGNTTGIGASGILDALGAAQEVSGRLDLAQQLAPLMAEYSDATGADIGDVGRTTGQIFQSLGARGNLSDAEMLSETKEILASMAGQAKKGSIEFADLAQQMGKVMSATAGFEGKTSELAETMGAVAQISLAGGASSPEEAMTAIMRMRDDIIQNNGGFADIANKRGVNVFTDESKTAVRNPVEIIAEMLKVSKGDLTKVNKLFGIRGYKAVQPFQQAFVDAGGAEDPEKGVAMMMSVLNNVRGAKMGDQERLDSAALTRAQPGRQFNIALEKLQDEMGEKLLPKVTELIPAIAKLTPDIIRVTESLVGLAGWIADNPLEAAFIGLGAVVTKNIVSELVSAGIGNAVSSAITRLIGGATVPIPGAGAAAGGGLGKAALVAGGAVAATVGVSALLASGSAAEGRERGKKIHGTESGGLMEASLANSGMGAGIPGLAFAPGMSHATGAKTDVAKKAEAPAAPQVSPEVYEQQRQAMTQILEAAGVLKSAGETLNLGAEKMNSMTDINRTNPLTGR